MSRLSLPAVLPARGFGAWALVLAVMALSACGDKKPGATQTAAKVNKAEITVHQINFVLQQQRNLKPEQAEAAGKQVLDKLIDQELAVQKADELKLDRDPRVVQQLEAMRREVLARAYAEKVGETANKPSPAEIKAYFEANPALFKERRVYNIQELLVEASPDRVPELRDRLAATKTLAEFAEQLKASNIAFSGNQAVRAAEQLPLQHLPAIAALKDGQSMIIPGPAGVQVVSVVGSRSQPVSEEQAKPLIEQYLLNDRKRKLVEEDLKTMRAQARIEYTGNFAQGAKPADAPAVAAQPPASTPAPPAPAASGLSAGDISKGLGLK